MNDDRDSEILRLGSWAERARLAFDLDGEVAIVTGAARGIGRSIAGVLGGAGASVVLTDVLRDDLDEVVEEFRRDGVSCEARVLDVSSRSDVVALVNDVATKFRKLDVMVNNAAIISDTSALHVLEAEIDRVHGVNFKGAVFGSQAAASVMIPKRKGSIISILSAAIDLPTPTVPAYATAKAASAQFGRSLAAEIAKWNVRVNAVAPGWTDTPMNHRHSISESGAIDGSGVEAYRNRQAASIPLGTTGTPEDHAFAVLYLASPASRFVTGSVIRPNGGAVMPW
jgi:3-oxoacyl-[acyl-carrier protein] reductase